MTENPEHLTNVVFNQLLTKHFHLDESIKNISLSEIDTKIHQETGKFPSCEFNNELFQLAENISETELIDFNTRFDYLITEKDELYTVKNKPKQCTNYFGVRGNTKDKLFGKPEPDSSYIINNGKIVAKLVYTMTTYHWFNADTIFAGTVGEIISQLPTLLKKSDKPFYYTSDSVGHTWTPDCHYAKINFYEKI